MTPRRIAALATLAGLALIAGCASTATPAAADPPVDHLVNVRHLQVSDDSAGDITVGCYGHDLVYWQEAAGGTALAVSAHSC